MTTADAETMEARTLTYGLLQALFRYPLSREKLEPLRRLESGVPALEAPLAELRQLIGGVDDWTQFVEDLNVEYTRLLEGPGGVPAPPYASFYVNGGRLMGAEAVAVKRRYAQSGIIATSNDGTPEDHVAVELAFMSHLGAEAAAAARDEPSRAKALVDAQLGFLSKHLVSWLPAFCSRLQTKAKHRFFVLLATLLLVVLENDAQWLAQVGSEADIPPSNQFRERLVGGVGIEPTTSRV